MSEWDSSLPQRLAQVVRAPRRYRPTGGGAMSYGRHCGPAPCDARSAAVLILLYPDESGIWTVPLTLRPIHLAAHAGQVSLPGGSLEPGETAWQAALREAYEELGIDPAVPQPIGPLTSLYVFNSNFLVQPWLAFTTARPQFLPNAGEVAEVVELPLTPLPTLDPARRMTIRRGQLAFSAPYWECGTLRVWGATLMILSELATLIACLEGNREPYPSRDGRRDV